MLSKVFSGTTIGIDGIIIAIEVDISSRGLPTFQIVGLPNKSVDEARVRVRSAMENSGFELPDTKIVINLAPANLRKEGSLFDLGIAVGIVAARRKLTVELQKKLERSMFLGELSLHGEVLPVNGTLPMVIAAKERGYKTVYVPEQNVKEAALIDGVKIVSIRSIEQCLVLVFESHTMKEAPKSVSLPHIRDTTPVSDANYVDFSEIKGQMQAKRAAEITAAGGHNLHLSGPPGTGKTLIARAIAGILPPMRKDEMIEVAKIYSVSQASDTFQIPKQRPFRAPHHSISLVGLIGGGVHARPGEMSLAHRGVLFLDEFPEISRYVIESLRQPLEDGFVTISRIYGVAQYPARCMLVVASNPCPCGYSGHATKSCSCSSSEVLRYRKKISGPMLDRIDIHVTVPPIDKELLLSKQSLESSAVIIKRVQNARKIQKMRFKNFSTKTMCNAEMSPKNIKQLCRMEKEASELLKSAYEKFSMSPRSYFKTIKVAQTIADLDARPDTDLYEDLGTRPDAHFEPKKSESINAKHMAEALQYRFEK